MCRYYQVTSDTGNVMCVLYILYHIGHMSNLISIHVFIVYNKNDCYHRLVMLLVTHSVP